MVQYAKEQDLLSWMELVRAVRWNFPGLETEAAMEEYKATVLKFMKDNRALCVKDGAKVIGVLLFSKKHNMICCLAVSPEYRKQGIGSSLLTAALNDLDSTRDITVSTFREDDPKGVAPRAFYRKFGFVAGELARECDYPVQVFLLRPQSQL